MPASGYSTSCRSAIRSNRFAVVAVRPGTDCTYSSIGRYCFAKRCAVLTPSGTDRTRPCAARYRLAPREQRGLDLTRSRSDRPATARTRGAAPGGTTCVFLSNVTATRAVLVALRASVDAHPHGQPLSGGAGAERGHNASVPLRHVDERALTQTNRFSTIRVRRSHVRAAYWQAMPRLATAQRHRATRTSACRRRRRGPCRPEAAAAALVQLFEQDALALEARIGDGQAAARSCASAAAPSRPTSRRAARDVYAHSSSNTEMFCPPPAPRHSRRDGRYSGVQCGKGDLSLGDPGLALKQRACSMMRRIA